MSTLHLHHLVNSRSFRIIWMLEELGIEYDLTIYQRNKQNLAPKSLTLVHPSGKAPILEIKGLNEDNPNEMETLIESGHILDVLMAKYDVDFNLHPQVDASSKVWRNYDFWMHYAEATIMPSLVMRLVFTKIVEHSPMLIKPVARGMKKQIESVMIAKNIEQSLTMIEAQLAENQWFAGSDFTAADIQMYIAIVGANAGQGLDKVKYTNILNWLKRCKARPAYQAAEERGGKIEF